MEKKSKTTSPSEFRAITGLEYFDFEEDFVEKNMRCIPMIVRLKLDLAGIKLRLDEWNRLLVEERIGLATRACSDNEEATNYRNHLVALVRERSQREATDLAKDLNPAWADLSQVPELLKERLAEEDVFVSLSRWRKLTDLQRFALLKLCRPGHESKNFAKALKEFGLMTAITAFAD
jgi:hypothetical protein